MKPTLIAAGAALALFAGAATANAANPSTTSSPTPSYAAPVVADADAMKAADQLQHTNMRQQLQDQLTKAGYTGVKITASSFFVQAKDKKGNPVAMIIGPDSFTEVTDILQKPSNMTAQQTPNNSIAELKQLDNRQHDPAEVSRS